MVLRHGAACLPLKRPVAKRRMDLMPLHGSRIVNGCCPWWNQVIDALVDHFMSYLSESRDLPVLWHQSLLVFAQRYRGDITRAGKDRLKEVSDQPYGWIEGRIEGSMAWLIL